MNKKKKNALIFVVLATVLLILDVIHVIKINKTGTGLWDFLPGAFTAVLFICYPIFFIIGYVLSGLNRGVKHKWDFIINTLLIINIFSMVLIIISFIVFFFKSL